MILWLLAGAFASPNLDRARAEALAYPGDYAAQVRLARVAGLEQSWDEAFDAWTSAIAISAANLESVLGRSVLSTARGAHRRAIRDARTATRTRPDSADAWLTLGWAWRNNPVLPGRGHERAAAAYRRATRLAQGPGHCGLGWMQRAQGNRTAARQSFRQSMVPEGCGTTGLSATQPAWTAWGTAALTASAYQGDPDVDASVVGHLSAGTTWDERVTLQLTGRGLGFFSNGGAGLFTSGQYEVWGQASAFQGGHGARLTAAAVLGYQRASVVGLDAWVTWWARARVGMWWSRYGDGDILQGSADVRTPWTRHLSTTQGLHLTTYRAGEVLVPTVEESLNMAGSIEATLEFRRVRLKLGSTFGPQYRPVRIDDPSLYNTDSRIMASGSIATTALLTPTMDVHVAYEVLRLQPPASQDLRHQHLFTVGLTLHPSRTSP